MSSVRDTKTFNRTAQFAEGWYWALPSRALRRGKVKPVQLMGRDLAIYRGRSGRVVAVDAHCPHMGAHLAEGRVDGDALRCFFHGWRFEPDGACSEAPQLEQPPRACLRTWPTTERHGLIWVWTGPEPRLPAPCAPELEDVPVRWAHGNRFVKGTHPNVVMINAIDAHHFNTVHRLVVDLDFETTRENAHVITFANRTRVPTTRWLLRQIGRFYAGPLTYSMSYAYASSGTVTVGPDLLHCHILFALRMTPEGHTEGQTVLLTPRRRGPLGWLFDRVVLFATKLVGNYFAKGDTRIFQTIKFDFQTPTKADRSIIEFIRHAEEQPAVAWGTWAPVEATTERPAGRALPLADAPDAGPRDDEGAPREVEVERRAAEAVGA